MFNTYNYNPSQRVSINAVSGTISKTCEKSFFKYAQIGSDLFKALTNNKPTIFLEEIQGRKPVIVLQAMCIGDNYMMFEVVFKEDFEQLKENRK